MSKSKGLRKSMDAVTRARVLEQVKDLVAAGVAPAQIVHQIPELTIHSLRKLTVKNSIKYSHEARSEASRVLSTKTVYDSGITTKILELREAGLKRREIADQLGISINKVHFDLQRNPKRELTPEEMAQRKTKYGRDLKIEAVELRKQGLSLEQIAEKLALKPDTVRYFCAQADVTLTPEQRRNNNGVRIHSLQVDDEIDRLRRKGVFRREIAERLGVPVSKVRTVIGQRKIPDPEILTNTWEEARAICVELGFEPLNYPETGKVFGSQNHDWEIRCHCGRRFAPHLNSVLCRRVRSCGCVKSFGEAELGRWVEELGFRPVKSERTIIAPYEIDVYIPDLKIGIEYNGLHWHGESPEGTSGKQARTFVKWEMAKAAGIRLLTIFEDEWLFRNEQTKGYLRTILGTPMTRVGARECSVRCGSDDIREFLDQNHIQGKAVGECYSLWSKEHGLVAAAVFSVPNASRNVGDAYDLTRTMELNRYCIRVGYSVPGGLSKILKSFKNDHPGVDTLISYSDNRWSEGGIYRSHGFIPRNEAGPSYWYFRANTSGPREHRYRWRKSACLEEYGADPSMTEWQIMQANGWDRVWDCGTTRWELSLNT